MLDEMLTYLQTVRERPAWQAVPDAVKARLAESVPIDLIDATVVYELPREHPAVSDQQHPPPLLGLGDGNRYPVAMLADMLASGVNVHLAGYDQSAMLVERRVISWLTELMGRSTLNSGRPLESAGMVVSCWDENEEAPIFELPDHLFLVAIQRTLPSAALWLHSRFRRCGGNYIGYGAYERMSRLHPDRVNPGSLWGAAKAVKGSAKPPSRIAKPRFHGLRAQVKRQSSPQKFVRRMRGTHND